MQFQQPLKDAFADFCRKQTFVAGTVVSGNGEEIGLTFRKIGDGIAHDFSYHEGRPRETVCAGSRADVDLVAGQIRFPIRRPCECHVPCRRA